MEKYMKDGFVHLHVHTHHSLKDGIGTSQEYFKKIKEQEIGNALAVSEHGNLNSSFSHFKAGQQYGSKGIYGCELYCAQQVKHEETNKETGQKKSFKDPTYHALVLAKNENGFKNLLKLNYLANTNNFYYRPITLFNELFEHHEGLIITSACLGSFINKFLLADKEPEALQMLEKFKQVFGQDFYLELQLNELPKQKIINTKLIELGQAYNIPLTLTNDVHYTNPGDARYQDVSKMIGYSQTISSEKIFKTDSRHNYLVGRKELQQFNKDFEYGYSEEFIDKLCDSTLEIAQQCNYEFDTKTYKLPKFQVPENYQTSFDLLKVLVSKNFVQFVEEKIIPEVQALEYIKRLEYELQVIKTHGFADYFLILEDLLTWARGQEIAVSSCGRGSVSGCLLAFLLKLTYIDPIKFGLLFERFLNPERIKLPDIDVDFDVKRKGEIEEYLKNKYGKDSVCHVGTVLSFHMKGILRDLTRIFDRPKDEIDQISKIIAEKVPEKFHNDIQLYLISLKEEFETKLEPNSKEKFYLAWFEKNQDIVDLANGLYNRARTLGTHAAGIIITNGPLYSFLPVNKIEKNLVSGYSEGTEEKELSDLKILKVDALGLKNLNIIQDAIKLIKQRKNIDLSETLSPYNFNLNDKKLYQEMNYDDGVGIFQFESDGIRKLLQTIKPNGFEDISACVALFRPATLKAGSAYDFAKAKNDINFRPSVHPLIQPILDNTYNCVVYQEQLMFLLDHMTGVGLGKADLWRKECENGFGDKQGNLDLQDFEGEKQRKPKLIKFLKEYQELSQKKHSNLTPEEQEEILFFILGFSNYLFNKSHCVSYSMIAMQTLYLKTYYALEFYLSLLNYADDEDEIKKVIKSALKKGIEFLPLNINQSDVDFKIEDDKIRVGLKIIKGLGEKALLKLMAFRPFTDWQDFVQKAPKMNKGAIEALVGAGATQPLHDNQSLILEAYKLIYADLKRAASKQQGWQALMKDFKEPEPLDIKERSLLQKEYLGFDLNKILAQKTNPLLTYRKQLTDYPLSYFADQESNGLILIQVEDVEIKKTKAGKEYCVLQCNDGQSLEKVKYWQNPSPLIEGMVAVIQPRYSEEWGWDLQTKNIIKLG